MALRNTSHLTHDRLVELWERASEELSKPGRFFCGDISIPKAATHRGRKWRCLHAPRLSLFIAGAHRLVYVKSQIGVEIRPQSGDVLFLPSDSHDDEIFESTCQYLGIVFHPNLTRFIRVSHRSGEEAPPLGTPYFYHFHAKRPPSIHRLLQNLEELSGESNPNPGIGRLLSHALWLETIEWLRKTPQDQPTHGKAFTSWLAIENYLRENYHLPINRDTAGEALQLHTSRISALCRKFASSSFQELLEGKRLQRAKLFLSESDSKLERIAEMCGYNHASYFIRAFRKLNSVTPGTWRLENRRNIVAQRAAGLHGDVGEPVPSSRKRR